MPFARRFRFCAPLVIGLVLFTAASALAQTYPLPTPTPTAQVQGGVIEHDASGLIEPSVKGIKVTAPTEEILPLTGGDVVGMALFAGLLISLGTMFSTRRPGARASKKTIVRGSRQT